MQSSPNTSEQRISTLEQELQALNAALAEQQRSTRVHLRLLTGMLACLGFAGTLFIATSRNLAAAAPKVGTDIKAPFRILNSAGGAIIAVYESTDGQGLYVRNKAGQTAGSLEARNNGSGMVAVYDGAPPPAAGTAPQAESPPSIVADIEDGQAVIRLNGPKGYSQYQNLGLSIRRGGNPNIVIGSYSDQGGAVRVFNPSGNLTGEMATKGGFRAFDSSGVKPVAEFGATESRGSGRLWLANTAGVAMVEGGMTADGRGIVRVGPVCCAGPSSFRVPDHIEGHKE